MEMENARSQFWRQNGDEMETKNANFGDRMAMGWRRKMPVAKLGGRTNLSAFRGQAWRQIVSI